MRENPILAVTKIVLLAAVAVLLLLQFVAHNETQSKVIGTGRAVDEVRTQVQEIRRALREGVRTGEPAATVEAPTGPRIEGYTVLFGSEHDRPRPPDEEINFDATLFSALQVEPQGFNVYTSQRDRYVAVDLGYYVYGSLAMRMNRGKDEYKPYLAERVEVSPDHRTFHIWLRKGVRWHRPPVDLTSKKYEWMRGDHEVTAEDYVFALDMLFNENADTGAMRAEFEKIEKYEALDPHHLVVRYREADFFATGVLMGDLMPIPRWIYTREEDGSPIDEASMGQRFAAHWFNKKMCGCGPYVFKEYKEQDYILLERNEDYWGRRPAYRYIRYTLNLKEDAPRFNMFMRTNAQGIRDQYAYPISPVRWKLEFLDPTSQSPLLKQLLERKLYVFSYQRKMFAYAGWANRGRFFSDPRVRTAMTLAANREAWQKEILADVAIFPTGVAYTESPEYDSSIPPLPYDLERAKSLLTEAGWVDSDGNGVREKTIDGVKTEFRFKMLQTSGSSGEIDAMRQDWEQSLRKIGVVMESEFAEWNLFMKKVKDREFDAFSSAWFHGDDFDPDGLWHSRHIDVPASHNYVEFSNPRVDRICEELKTCFDLKRRYELCHEFHRILYELQPYTVLWSWRNPVAVDSAVGGLKDPRVFTPQIDILDLYEVRKPPAPYDDGRYERPKRS